MSLNNIFQMIKADRYTADGREEIKKALAEETEDRTYNIGEISEKTGLQKTANGWVRPAGLKGLSEKGKEEVSKNVAAKLKQNEQSYEKYKIPREKKEAIRAANRNAGSAKKEEFNGVKINKKAEEQAKREGRTDILPSGISTDDFSDKQLKEYADGLKEALTTQNNFTEETRASTEKELKAVEAVLELRKSKTPESKPEIKPAGRTGDSAPRVLTGDCKIRIRK